MINRKLDNIVSRYREKLFIFIKCTHCTGKIGGVESVHIIIVCAKNRIQNTAPVHWILVKSNTFFHWVQKVRQIENAIRVEVGSVFSRWQLNARDTEYLNHNI